MKKEKRFLTGLLSAALALSLCAMPAMAADAPALPETTKTTDSVIDPDKKGSITIYKYLHDKDIVSENGTGEKQNIPDGTEPAEDVGFTIYQVKMQPNCKNIITVKQMKKHRKHLTTW